MDAYMDAIQHPITKVRYVGFSLRSENDCEHY